MYKSPSSHGHSGGGLFAHGGLLSCSDPARWLLVLVSVSLLLNLGLAAVLWTGRWEATSGSGAGYHVASQQPSSETLASDLATWKASHAQIQEQFETLKTHYTQLQANHVKLRDAVPSSSDGASELKLQACDSEVAQLRQKINQVQQEAASSKAICPACPSCPVQVASKGGDCPPCENSGVDHSRLLKDDLTLQPFDPATHEHTWSCTAALSPASPNETMKFCPETTTNEQFFQLSFFERPGAGSRAAIRKPKPQSPSCVQLPPRDYKFPRKVQSMPLAEGEEAVHWPNLRAQKLEDLLEFNRGTPKNLYHFNASFYDYEQEHILDAAAAVIPFGHKVRTMLDVGSGGASLGMLAKRRYDVQVVSTVFADWPYCEYISERGQICMYIDAMEAMPFAKFSYDVVHSSWVFHALFNDQLRHAFLEQNRILRPGGYMWIYGGWSKEQVDTIHHLFIEQLGYTYLTNDRHYVKSKTKFDTVPYELDWTAVMVKPIRADDATCRQ